MSMATNDTPGGDGWQWPPSGPRHDSGAGLFAHLPARLPPPGRRARPCAAPAGSAAVARWPGWSRRGDTGWHGAARPADLEDAPCRFRAADFCVAHPCEHTQINQVFAKW